MRSLDDISAQSVTQAANVPAVNLQAANVQTLIPAIGLDWSKKATIPVRASLLGERIIIKALDWMEALTTNPLTVRAGATGCAVILRYGVIVTFDLSAEEESALIAQLKPHVREASEPGNAKPKVFEELQVAFRPQGKERLEGNILWLQECSAERLQIMAEALGKSVVLDYYEREVSSLFDRIKPFTTAIQGKNVRSPKEKELLSYIGGTLLIQQKMLGIVEVGEKPDPIWDYPDLDRLYLRLEDEYELRERLVALEQKLALVSRTVETSLAILQRDSSHRVEWYIVILIVVEIVLSLYDLWTRR